MKPDVSVAGVFLEYRPLDSVRRFASGWGDRLLLSTVVGWIRPVALLFVGLLIYSALGVPADILAFLGVMVASVSLLVIGPFAVVSVIVSLLEAVE